MAKLVVDSKRQVVDTLTVPVRPDTPYPDEHYHRYLLKLADLALSDARKEQERIKEQIRPHVERYKLIRGLKSTRRKVA